MTLTVRYCLFVRASVLYFPEDAGGLPVLIPFLLDGLYPEVRNIHCHTVVEAISSILKPCCQSRHARDLLSYCDSIRIYLVYEQVGQCEITYGIIILMSVEIISIVGECLP